MTVKVTGIDKVLENLNKEIGKLRGRSMKGLLKAGLLVQREAQKKTPVELGNLRGSAYTRKAQKNELAVEIGFEAAYALFVHENREQKLKGQARPSKLGKYWGPSGEPGFLTNALKRNQATILKIIAKEAKIP